MNKCCIDSSRIENFDNREYDEKLSGFQDQHRKLLGGWAISPGLNFELIDATSVMAEKPHYQQWQHPVRWRWRSMYTFLPTPTGTQGGVYQAGGRYHLFKRSWQCRELQLRGIQVQETEFNGHAAAATAVKRRQGASNLRLAGWLTGRVDANPGRSRWMHRGGAPGGRQRGRGESRSLAAIWPPGAAMVLTTIADQEWHSEVN
jgi:hypothetical protein